MTHYMLIENERAVDVAHSPEDAANRTQYGWRVAIDCAGDDWRDAKKGACLCT